ncbi:PQ loop repeat protein, partial [Penicillium maclennaniae]|uniref:PQ loop repeat protein n=1 Tax=Penicillium maclennaniae TaxID=1343394 RepID=UPI0025425C81
SLHSLCAVCAYSYIHNMSGDNITVASNVLGTIGTVLWCIQLIPQIWYNWRRKTTDGFPAVMMLLWASCSVPMGAYLILQEVSIPLQIQPQMFGFFSLVNWGQILYYNHNYSRLKATIVCSGCVLLFGGIEALLILTLRIPYENGVMWPDLVVCHPGCVGRSGESNLADEPIAAQGKFDILAGILYILVVVLELGIYASHITWRIRYRKLRREAKMAGKSIDDLLRMQQTPTPATRDLESGVLEDSGKTLPQEPREHQPQSTLAVEGEMTSEKC